MAQTPPKTQSRAILAFYIDGGIGELVPIYPLYSVMFMDHGVSAFGFSALLMIWSLSAMIVEIPSGALADRFSRKWLLVLGAAGCIRALHQLAERAFPNSATKSEHSIGLY